MRLLLNFLGMVLLVSLAKKILQFLLDKKQGSLALSSTDDKISSAEQGGIGDLFLAAILITGCCYIHINYNGEQPPDSNKVEVQSEVHAQTIGRASKTYHLK